MNEQSTFIKFFVLPKETTEVELRHVRSINRVALGVCVAHLPLFILVAWLCGTSTIQALLFGTLLITGPAVANFTINNPRHLSLIYGFTSMGLGALLVHLGQGPMQIEMHFHFFAALALLTVWGNPLIIWVATITVATHHGLFYFFLPKSVFNYEASIWVVVVHASFVVAEAIAAAFIARNFFDNVIGLEKIVAHKTEQLSARNRDMRLILDNSEQGFLTCTLDGHIGSECSAIVEKWFGKPSQTKVWDFVTRGDQKMANLLREGWNQLVDDYLPFEVCAGQMPRIVQCDSSSYSFNYLPIYNSQKVLGNILVVVSDVTAQVEAVKRDRHQQEMLATFQALSKDRVGFLEYFSDAENMVRTLSDTKQALSKELQFRLIHTLKGNSAQYGLATLAEVCHELESKLHDQANPLQLAEISKISAAWEAMSSRLITLIGNRKRQIIELEVADYVYVLKRIKENASSSEIAGHIERWRLEPAVKRLDRIAEQAKSLATRLDLENIVVETCDNDVRLEPDSFSDVWTSMIHIIRNSIDHGFVESGIQNPKLSLVTQKLGNNLLVSVRDNGRGVDWEKIRIKAKQMSLPWETQQDLEKALFADGLTTKTEVSSISGRGIGMAAVLTSVHSYGGSITVYSQPGQGTEFKIELPISETVQSAKNKAA